MYYIVYKTTNLINNKIYIGMHITNNLDDSYLGSGKLLISAVKKYGKENFVREILFNFDNETDMREKEAELVSLDFCLLENTYNLCMGGKGGFGYINRSGISKFKGKKHSDETREKLKQIRNNLSSEVKQRIAEATSKANKERDYSTRVYSAERYKKVRAPKSDEVKRKISESHKNVYENMSEEKRQLKREHMLHIREQHKQEFLSETQKEKISIKMKTVWSNGTRLRFEDRHNFKEIQNDFDNGMSREDLFKKHKISRNFLREARAKKLFVGEYKKCLKKPCGFAK